MCIDIRTNISGDRPRISVHMSMRMYVHMSVHMSMPMLVHMSTETWFAGGLNKLWHVAENRPQCGKHPHTCAYTCLRTYLYTSLFAGSSTCLHRCLHKCLHTSLHTCLHAHTAHESVERARATAGLARALVPHELALAVVQAPHARDPCIAGLLWP